MKFLRKMSTLIDHLWNRNYSGNSSQTHWISVLPIFHKTIKSVLNKTDSRLIGNDCTKYNIVQTACWNIFNLCKCSDFLQSIEPRLSILFGNQTFSVDFRHFSDDSAFESVSLTALPIITSWLKCQVWHTFCNYYLS